MFDIDSFWTEVHWENCKNPNNFLMCGRNLKWIGWNAFCYQTKWYRIFGVQRIRGKKWKWMLKMAAPEYMKIYVCVPFMLKYAFFSSPSFFLSRNISLWFKRITIIFWLLYNMMIPTETKYPITHIFFFFIRRMNKKKWELFSLLWNNMIFVYAVHKVNKWVHITYHVYIHVQNYVYVSGRNGTKKSHYNKGYIKNHKICIEIYFHVWNYMWITENMHTHTYSIIVRIHENCQRW